MNAGTGCLVLIFFGLLRWVIVAGVLMLFVGVLHAELAPEVPAISFRAAMLISAPLLLLVALLTPSNNS